MQTRDTESCRRRFASSKNCTTSFALPIFFFNKIFPLQLFSRINRFLNLFESNSDQNLIASIFSFLRTNIFLFLFYHSLVYSLLSRSFTDIRSSHPLPPLFSTPIHSFPLCPFLLSSFSLSRTWIEPPPYLTRIILFSRLLAIVESNKLTDDGIVGRWGMRGEL